MNHYLGIDLGGSNIRAGIVDGEYNLIHQYKTPTLSRRPFAEVIADMANAAAKAVAEAGMHFSDFGYIGVGAPSSIHPETGNLVLANNLGWRDVDLAGALQRHIGLPVIVENDADTAAYGEAVAGAAGEERNVLMLTLGTGLGGAVILEKEIFRGANGHGCEPGHMTLVMDGAPCTCGRRGCFEAYASITGIKRMTLEAMAADPKSLMHEICDHDLRKIKGRTAFIAAKQGDAAGRVVVSDYMRYLAAGIGSLVTIFRPDVVVLGGGLSNEGEYLLGPVRRMLPGMVHASDLLEPPRIIQSALGSQGGIIGAALLGLQQAWQQAIAG